MSNFQYCTSCGLIHQDGQCRLQTSTTPPSRPPIDITPDFCCISYLVTIGLSLLLVIVFLSFSEIHAKRRICYVELFANSVSISNTNASAADWRVGFVARSPVTNCKVSLQTLKSRLLRGDKVMSDSLSQSSGCSGQVLTRDKTNVVFENVVMPEVIDDVIWDFRVDIVSKVNTNVGDVTVFMMATCPDIPVKFTTDPAGKVMGSLHGNMRRCDYIFRCNLGNYLQP